MTRPPETLDEIPWATGEEQLELQLAEPRRCRHPKERRITEYVQTDTVRLEVLKCGLCGHRFDPERRRRGRAVRKYGKAEELSDARQLGLEPRGTSRDPEDSGGALDPAVVQSKTGPVHYPSASWIAELEALAGVAHGRPRILVATPKLGRGRKRRKVAVMYLDELQELSGLGLKEAEQLLRDLVAVVGAEPIEAARMELVELGPWIRARAFLERKR